MRTQSPIRRLTLSLTVTVLAASLAAVTSAAGAQDTAAVHAQRQRLEVEKLRAETQNVQAETEKARAETRKADAEAANLGNFFLRFLPVLTAAGAVVGGLIGLWKFFDGRNEARRHEISETARTLLPQLGEADPNARISAASSLGMMATLHAKELPELPLQVAAALFGHMAQSTITASEQATFANVVNVLLAGRTELPARPPKGADLSNVKFAGLTLRAVPLEEVKLANTSFRQATLEQMTLEGVTATHAEFAGSIVKDATFRGSTLTDVSFDGATVERLAFENCTLTNCAFTNLPGTPELRFTNCPTLFGLKFAGTDVSRLSITKAADVPPNTVAELKTAKGIAAATLDDALAAKVRPNA
jgi:uncharacterized protein YjbI with pentapeptide repeats